MNDASTKIGIRTDSPRIQHIFYRPTVFDENYNRKENNISDRTENCLSEINLNLNRSWIKSFLSVFLASNFHLAPKRNEIPLAGDPQK